MGIVRGEVVDCRMALMDGKYWLFGAGRHVLLFSLLGSLRRAVCSLIKLRRGCPATAVSAGMRRNRLAQPMARNWSSA